MLFVLIGVAAKKFATLTQLLAGIQEITDLVGEVNFNAANMYTGGTSS